MLWVGDQLLGRLFDWIISRTNELPPIRNFRRSRKLAQIWRQFRFLFNVDYRYSLNAFCLCGNAQESERALTITANVGDHAHRKPTFFNEEWNRQVVDVRRITNEMRDLVRGVGNKPKPLNYAEIYSQLQPRLNELMMEIEKVIEEQLPRFPADISFIGVA
ncbi:MAG: hypothetical protein KCHDKBKB_01013 [Elusimicrobia bacterium]|nr:hypothetical protein [Elusimicrobiota bacterium]